MELTLQEIFETAYGLLAPDAVNHLKGLYGGVAQGGYCALGALRQAGLGTTTLGPEYFSDQGQPYRRANALALEKVLALNPENPMSITQWNDLPERTKADVLALFRQLADEAAAGTRVAA